MVCQLLVCEPFRQQEASGEGSYCLNCRDRLYRSLDAVHDPVENACGKLDFVGRFRPLTSGEREELLAQARGITPIFRA